MRNTTLNLWRLDLFSSHWPRALAALGLLLFASATRLEASNVTTLGGGSVARPYYGDIDGNTLSAAKFNMPTGLALDPSGTTLFVADYTNNAIRLVSQVGNAASSMTTTFANATNGAGISHPLAVVVDSATNIYVLNQGNGANGAVLHLGGVTMNSGIVQVYSSLATGLANATAMTMDGYNNLYVTVNGNKVIKVTTNKVVTTVGTVTQSGTSLRGIAVLDNGQLALSDAGNNGIWIMNPLTGSSTKLTGFHGAADVLGSASLAAFNTPETISKAGGGILVVADSGNNKVKLVDLSGTATLLYGVSSNLWITGSGTFPGWANGTGSATQGSAESRLPYGVLVGPNGNVYVSEDYYHVLRLVTSTGLSGPQPGYLQLFNAPNGIALDPSGSSLYIADYPNNAVQLLNLNNNLTATYLDGSNGVSHPASVLVDTNSNIYVLNQNAGTNGSILEFDSFGNFLGTNITGLNQPTALTMDGNGNIFIVERTGSIKVLFPSGFSNTIVTISTNIVTLKTNVQLQGIAIFDDGNLAVSDAGNHVIWTINPITKLVSKLTGQLGTNGITFGNSNQAKLYQPHQLARAGNNQLIIADYGNNRLVVCTRSGTITNSLASTNSQVWFGRPSDPVAGSTVPMLLPSGLAVSSAGLVYDSEPTNAAVRGLTTAVVAPPSPPIVSLPYFNTPEGIAFDGISDYLFIADYANNAVQLLDLNDNTTSEFLAAGDGVSNPASVLVDTNENIYVLNQGTPGNGFIQEYDVYGNDYGPIVTGLNQPTAFTMDGYGVFFVTEQSGNVRAFGTGVSNTIVTVTNANVSLQGIALFDDGNIAVSDAGNHVIWTINPITKLVTKLTGQLGTNGIAVGASNFAKLYQPHQLVRVGGNQVVCADYGNNRLVLVQRNGTVITNNTTYHLNSSVASIWFGSAGDPVSSGSPKFVPMIQPFGITAGNGGEIFDSETYYEDIRGLTGTGLVSPSFNPGVPLPVYSSPAGIALNNESTSLFVADPINNTISQLNLVNNQTTVLLGSDSGIYQPVDVGLDSSDNLYVLNQGTGGNGSIMEFDKFGNLLATNASSLAMPTAMKLSFSGDIYVSELNGTVQKFNSSGSNTLANITTNANVRLQGIAVLDNGSVVVSDAGNHVVWKIAPGTTNAVLFTGVIGTSGTNFGGVGSAKLNKPQRLAQANGGLLLIVDSGNNRVVVANDLGTVSAALNSTNADIWFGLPIDPVAYGGPSFVPMLSPIGVAIGLSGTVFDSESIYKDIRGMLNTGIQAPIPPPPAPLNLVATATYGQVSLTWSASIGATNYNVRRSTSTNAAFSIIGSTSATSFIDTNVLGGSTYYYVVSAVNAGGESPNSAIVSATPLIPPPPAPRIGWFDYEGNNLTGFFSVLHPFSILTFNNDQLFAIDPVTNGVSTYYTTDGSIPAATNGSTPPFYADNHTPFLPSLTLPPSPDTVIKAINVDVIGQVSPITTAEIVFQCANPTISGFNGAQFVISDVTTNTAFWYTTDGTDPTNAPPSIGPVAANGTNSATLSLVVNSNIIFKVRAFRTGYFPSGIAIQSFSPSNFVANTISFGFAAGEASSDFVASPGQTFYAPVTLTTLSGTVIYSLQFNLVATNAGPNPGPAIAPNTYGFQSMLMKPDPANQGQFLPIPPFAFVTSGLNPQPNPYSIYYDGNWFQSLESSNSLENLLTVGWLERVGKTNLYDTKSQELITYSLAHDDLFPNAQDPNEVILGGYSVLIPGGATNGQTYQIQIGRPSATSDGVGAPGSDVFIAAPTNGATAGGAPVNALKFVTVGQRKYIAGSVYPFRWFNAGDFGSSNIVNADVEQVFQSAIYALNYPPFGSDFFDAMDSCGNYGAVDGDNTDPNFGYYTNSFVSLNPAQQNVLFDGNDTTINQVAFGDGNLDVCDVYVTFRRSLDPSLTWFRRFWNNGQRVADTNAPNVASHSVLLSGPARPNLQPGSTVAPQVNFTAGSLQTSAGQLVSVPITATIFGNYPLRLLMLNLTVEPLDGSPALTTPIQFNQTATVLGAPYTTDSTDNNNFSAVWLNSANAGLTNTVTIGNLIVTIPAGAASNAAYAVHFDHASASPNGLASFPKQTLTGLLTLSSRTNSSFGDGIPDSWRLRWFGTINNILSASNACPSGDGVPNWKKFVAGVDPNVANDFPSVNPRTPAPLGSTTAIHWPSVSGTKYAVERATSLFSSPWTILSTNIGTGTDMEFDDTNSAAVKFYRVRIVP